MKIIAVSDLHGNLISIRDKCDVFVIAGDWSPLHIQCDYNSIMSWFNISFIPWMKLIKSKHVVFISGNHDIACTSLCFNSDLDDLLISHNMRNRVHYLKNNSITLFGKKFYGNPNTEGLDNWAFSKKYNADYSFDSDTDILITHQPPLFGSIGFVKQTFREFGSVDLRNKILDSNISLNICGHIHTGEHGCHSILLNNYKEARVYNVSILDEDYVISYSPTIIEL